jgi:hypothetical protein|eukprot:COSAG06_NODE_10137_length_1742_cov_0.953743_3_plen_44_part_00
MIIGVLSVLADWNMVRDVDEQGRPVLRVLKPEEEERLMGMPPG